MNYKHLNFLDTYYAFAERCNDDYEIMAYALKSAGYNIRPSRIVKKLENIGVDSKCRDYYAKLMVRVCDKDIENAKRIVEFERLSRPRLF